MSSTQVATSTFNCKFPNCMNEASSPVGRYSYCRQHQGAAKPKPSGGVSGGKETLAQRLGSLQAAAKKADRLRAKAERLTREALKAKREADEEQAYFERLLADAAAGAA